MTHYQPRRLRSLSAGTYDDVHKSYIAVLLRAHCVDEATIKSVYGALYSFGKVETPSHTFRRTRDRVYSVTVH
jgi:hypothetical protein